MKRFLILACMVGAIPASQAFAGGLFWFHTRPKSVLLSDDSSRATQNRVAYHGTAMYPGSGRLYFEDSADHRSQWEQSRSRFMSVFSRGWLTGAAPSKSAPAKTTPAK
jgi:hypothetical protein